MSRLLRFHSRQRLIVLASSALLGLGGTAVAVSSAAVSSASGATAAPSPTPEAGMNPFGLPRLVSFKLKPTSVAITIACTGTAAQPCKGVILSSTNATYRGNKIVAVSTSTHAAKRKLAAIRIAQAPFSLVGGQTATIQLKLNSTGLSLVKRFHSVSAFVVAGEVIPQGKFVFLVHGVLFKTPVVKRK